MTGVSACVMATAVAGFTSTLVVTCSWSGTKAHCVLAHCPKVHHCTWSCTLLASIRLKPEKGQKMILRLRKFLDCAVHHIWIIQQYHTSSNSLLYWIF